MKRYEYRIESSQLISHLEERINKLGEKGWEVINLHCAVTTHCEYIYTLKRELEDEEIF